MTETLIFLTGWTMGVAFVMIIDSFTILKGKNNGTHG